MPRARMNSAISFAPENAKRQSSDHVNAQEATDTAIAMLSSDQQIRERASAIHKANRRTSTTKPKCRRPPIHLKIKIYTKNVYDPRRTKTANRELRTANSEATMTATPKT